MTRSIEYYSTGDKQTAEHPPSQKRTDSSLLKSLRGDSPAMRKAKMKETTYVDPGAFRQVQAPTRAGGVDGFRKVV